MAVMTYKCPGCGGGLRFDAEKQIFVCDYCGKTYSKEEIEALNPDSQQEKTEKMYNAEGEAQTTVLFVCPSCGAEIVTDETTAATYCFYCHNPVVLSGRLDREFLPRKVIPFAFDRDEAVKRFMKWIKTKKYVPKDFFSEKRVEKMTGVYFPYWLVDCDVDGAFDCKGTKIRVWCVGETEYTETSTYAISRAGGIHYEDITKCALKKLNKQLVESVQPFDGKGMLDFSPSYLLGFQAEKRDIERIELEKEVDANIRSYTEQKLAETVNGYGVLSERVTSAQVKAIDWAYTLLPVWVLTYKKDDKQYFYAMNGQTGKINGELPVDTKKLWRNAGIFAAVVAVVGMIVGYLI